MTWLHRLLFLAVLGVLCTASTAWAQTPVTETLVPPGVGGYRYLLTTAADGAPATWFLPDFDDRTWQVARGPLRTMDETGCTTGSTPTTVIPPGVHVFVRVVVPPPHQCVVGPAWTLQATVSSHAMVTAAYVDGFAVGLSAPSSMACPSTLLTRSGPPPLGSTTTAHSFAFHLLPAAGPAYFDRVITLDHGTCTAPSAVCNGTTGVCGPACRADADCTALVPHTRCDTGTGSCVRCVSTTDCPAGLSCLGHRCVQCGADTPCPSSGGSSLFCTADGTCGCSTDMECGSRGSPGSVTCMTAVPRPAGVCTGRCMATGECSAYGAGLVCVMPSGLAGLCLPSCTMAADCPAGIACVPGPSGGHCDITGSAPPDGGAPLDVPPPPPDVPPPTDMPPPPMDVPPPPMDVTPPPVDVTPPPVDVPPPPMDAGALSDAAAPLDAVADASVDAGTTTDIPSTHRDVERHPAAMDVAPAGPPPADLQGGAGCDVRPVTTTLPNATLALGALAVVYTRRRRPQRSPRLTPRVPLTCD